MNKRRKGVTIVALIMAVLLIFTLMVSVFGGIGAHAASQSEVDELKKIKQDIADKKKDLSTKISSLQSEKATVLERKEALDQQNDLTRQEIAIIVREMEIYDNLLAVKEKDVEDAQAKADMQLQRYRARVRAMEEMGDISYFSIIFKAKSFTDLLSRLDSIKEVIAADKKLEEDYIAAKAHVEQVKADYEIARADTEVTKAELEKKKTELEEDIKAATAIINELEADIAEYKSQYETAEADAQKVDAEISKMLEEIRKQEEEAKRLAEQNGTNPGIITGTGQFAWPLPSDNRVHSAYGWREHPIFGDMRLHAGIDIGGITGNPIVAVDDGTVITAVYSSSYGNYVIISHGNGLATLYAHQSSMAVKVGQTVKKGQTIGYVGSTGWATGPHLHFEVRVNGATVQPLNYFLPSQYVIAYT